MRRRLFIIFPILSFTLFGSFLDSAFSKDGTVQTTTSHLPSTSLQPGQLAQLTPLPLDQLLQNLGTSYRSKEAALLKRAYDAYKEGTNREANDKLAIHLISKMNSKGHFLDYKYWILSQIYRQKAEIQLSKNRFKLAAQFGKLAISNFLKIIENYPTSPFIRTSQKEMSLLELSLGESYWGSQDWNQSLENYEKALFRLQSQNQLIVLKPSHLLHYAEVCTKARGDYCRGWLDKLSSLFVKNSEESNLIFKALQSFPEKVPPAQKLKLPQFSTPSLKSLTNYKSPDLDQTAFTTAMSLYFEKSYSKAETALIQFLDDFPRSPFQFRARYWLGMALESNHETEKAQRIFQTLQADLPLTYYGMLASYKTGKSAESLIDGSIPMGIDSDSTLQPYESFRLKRSQELLAEKAYDLAGFELREIKAKSSFSSEFLIYLASLNAIAKNTNTSLQLATDLGQRGYPGIRTSMGLRIVFPQDHYELIQKYSQINNLDPILVLSLMKQESAFDETAGSSVGALGLMQLMPATALLTDPTINVWKLFRAEENIRIGTSYLKSLMGRFNENIILSLAGYNAGPNAVDRWIQTAGPNRPPEEFIDLIPYKETREYVASIIRNYFWYSRQIKGTHLTNLDLFWKPIPVKK